MLVLFPCSLYIFLPWRPLHDLNKRTDPVTVVSSRNNDLNPATDIYIPYRTCPNVLLFVVSVLLCTSMYLIHFSNVKLGFPKRCHGNSGPQLFGMLPIYSCSETDVHQSHHLKDIHFSSKCN